MRGCTDNSCVLLLGQHQNPLMKFHMWALQEDAAGTGSNQRLMWGLKIEWLVDTGVSAHTMMVGILREHNWGVP